MINNTSRLHNELIKFAGQYSDWADFRHLCVMCWMIVGLVAEGSVNLTRWIHHIDTKAQIAQSTVKRFSRWVNNPRINPAKLFSPIVKATFAHWQDPAIYLTFDTSMLWDRFCIIRLCVVHLGRAIPVGWRVLEHPSSSVQLATYEALLKRASKLLPANVKVVLLADRGFANPELFCLVRKLGWHCRIRIKGNFWLRHPKKGWQRVSQVPLAIGEAKLIQNVGVHKLKTLTDVHLAIAWEATSREKWYILSTETVDLQTFAEYGLRFCIEENFLDDKSNGFELESSCLRSAPALSRLCLVLAMTTMYLTAQGVEVVISGKRRIIDPHWFRGESYLKIGWNWIKIALTKDWPLVSEVFFRSNKDTDPAKASNKKHEEKIFKIQFIVDELNWAC